MTNASAPAAAPERSRTTLRTTLTARFLAAGLGTLLAALVVLGMQVRGAAQVDTETEVANHATRISDEVVAEFDAWRSSLLVASANAALREWFESPKDRPELRGEVEAILTSLHELYPELIDEACFIAADGRELARSTDGEVAPISDLSPDESEAPFFAPSVKMNAGEVYQSKPYLSEDSGRWVVANVTPIVVGGKTVAILHYEANLDAIGSALSTLVDKGDQARIVADTGELVATTDHGLGGVESLPQAGSWDDAHPVRATSAVPVAVGNANTWVVEVAAPNASFLTGAIIRDALVLIALVTAVLWFLAGRWSREITVPLRQVTKVAGAMATGDLSQRLDIERTDEIGTMALALDEANAQTSAMLTQVVNAASVLAASTDELRMTTLSLADAAQRSTGEASTANASAAEVSTSLRSFAEGTGQLSAAVGEISRSATQAVSVAAQAVQVATMASDTIAGLGTASEEIGAVVRVISQIAEQTNLLALNATIEAARAGESGKGFAVVAGEVKDLANETGRATEDIGSKVAGIQSGVAAAEEAINRIAAVIDEISGLQVTIAHAVEEQTATSQELEHHTDLAARSADGITSSIGGVAEAVYGTMAGLEQARASADRLSALADDLRGHVAVFTV